MRIAITSQNRTSVTPHAGACRRFWIYDIEERQVRSKSLLELGREQALHESRGDAPHPLDGVDVLISGGMGAGLAARMARRGTAALVTPETDPDRAVAAYLAEELEILPARCHDSEGTHCHHGTA
jgi:predicted Fe-Mo cluster-binding NifX family protein